MQEDARVFIQGRVSAEDDRASKLILEKIRSFDDVPRELWIQFENRSEATGKRNSSFWQTFGTSPGRSSVVIYLKDVKAMKKLPVSLAGTNSGLLDGPIWVKNMVKPMLKL